MHLPVHPDVRLGWFGFSLVDVLVELRWPQMGWHICEAGQEPSVYLRFNRSTDASAQPARSEVISAAHISILQLGQGDTSSFLKL